MPASKLAVVTNVHVTVPEPSADEKVSVIEDTPSVVIVLPGGADAITSEIFVKLYVTVTSVTVDVLGSATKSNVVVTSDPAWLGVVHAKLASTPKTKATENNRLFME